MQCPRSGTGDANAHTGSHAGPKRTYVVQRGGVRQEVDFQAQMAAVSELRMCFDTGGKVKKILVGPGEAATAGQVLANLDVAEGQVAVGP